MNSDIEQLLAGSDSDSDHNGVDGNDVDLEELLAEDDDDDDVCAQPQLQTRSRPTNVIALVGSSQSGAGHKSPALVSSSISPDRNASVRPTPVQVNSVKSVQTTSIATGPSYNVATSSGASEKTHTSTADDVRQSQNSLVIKTESDPSTSVVPSVRSLQIFAPVSSPPGSYLSRSARVDAWGIQDALELVEARERKYLEGGNREMISALQVKLSKLRETDKSESNLDTAVSTVRATKLNTVSAQLTRNAQYNTHGPGTATCLYVHDKFIAVGTSRGLVLLFDHFQEVRQVIGSATISDRVYRVTSLCVSGLADQLLTGYDDGRIMLWDVLKGAPLKTVTDVHHRAIKSLRYIAPPTTQSGEFWAVSIDEGGSMFRLRFSKILLAGYVLDSECLLDGTGGEVICVEPLPKPGPDVIPFHPAAASLASNLNQAVAFSSPTRTFLVQVAPSVNVLFRWAPPKELEEAGLQPSAPTTSTPVHVSHTWQWIPFSSGGTPLLSTQALGTNTRTIALLRSWETVLELLVLTTTSEPADQGKGQGRSEKGMFRVLRKMQLRTCVLAIKWLGMERAIAITTAGVLFIKSDLSSVLERVEFDGVMLTENVKWFECARVCDDKLYLLIQDEVFVCSVQSWTERFEELVKEGQWLEALALVLEQQRGEDALCAEVGSASPRGESVERADALLFRYVNLAIDNAPRLGAEEVSIGGRSHFHMVAGVCIEYCVEAVRLDLLFGRIYAKFTSSGQLSELLESLEPYILSSKIETVPPPVLVDIVEFYQKRTDPASLERLLVHLNAREMDLHYVLNFVASSRMYLAVLHVFSQGLRDFAGAFQVLAEEAWRELPSPVSVQSFSEFSNSSPCRTVLDRLMMFVYYSFTGRVFPRGLTSQLARDGARPLMALLLSVRYKSDVSSFWKREDSQRVDGNNLTDEEKLKSLASVQFPYLLLLACTDARSFFKCMKAAIRKGFALKAPASGTGFAPVEEEKKDGDILVPTPGGLLNTLYKFSKYAERVIADVKQHMLTGLAEEIVLCEEQIPKALVKDLVETLTNRRDAVLNPAVQEQVGQLVKRHPDVCDEELRDTLERRGFWRAVLIIHKARNRAHGSVPTVGAERAVGDFKQAIRCYLSDPEKTFSLQVFDFIDETLSFIEAGETQTQPVEIDIVEKPAQAGTKGRINYTRSSPSTADAGATRTQMDGGLRGVLVDVVVQLAKLDTARTCLCVCAHLSQEYRAVVDKTNGHSKLQFQILDALVQSSSTLGREGQTAILDAHTLQLYATLLATFEPHRVLEYLTSGTHSYDMKEMLALCKQKGIIDAQAFLLERGGDVANALHTILTEITNRIQDLRRAMTSLADSHGSEALTLNGSGYRGKSDSVSFAPANTDPLNHLPEWTKVKQAVDYAVELCQRNAPRDRQDGSEDGRLWFDVLDTLANERSVKTGPLAPVLVSEAMALAVGRLVKRLLEAMSRAVRSQEIVRWIARPDGTKTSGNKYAEFKEVMFSMVDAYSYEVFLYSTVCSMIGKDMHTVHVKKLRYKQGGMRVVRVDADVLPLSISPATSTSAAPPYRGFMMARSVGSSSMASCETFRVRTAEEDERMNRNLDPSASSPTRAKRVGPGLTARSRSLNLPHGRTSIAYSMINAPQGERVVLDLKPAPPDVAVAGEVEPRRPGTLPVHARHLRHYDGDHLS